MEFGTCCKCGYPYCRHYDHERRQMMCRPDCDTARRRRDQERPRIDDDLERMARPRRPEPATAMLLELAASAPAVLVRHPLAPCPARTARQRWEAKGRCGACGKKPYDCHCK